MVDNEAQGTVRRFPNQSTSTIRQLDLNPELFLQRALMCCAKYYFEPVYHSTVVEALKYNFSQPYNLNNVFITLVIHSFTYLTLSSQRLLLVASRSQSLDVKK